MSNAPSLISLAPRMKLLLRLTGIVAFAMLFAATCPAQSVYDSFNPGADGTVNRIAVQGDGRIVVGGAFSQIAGMPRAHLARLLADGSIDASFAATGLGGPSVIVSAIALQNDGKILVGGTFTAAGSYLRNNLARLNADGSVDTSFDPAPSGGIAGDCVCALAIQSDGRILVGGNFSQIAGAARTNLARLNPDGSIDGAFDPPVDSVVYALHLQSDARIVIGGSFNNVDAAPRHHIARLNRSGSLDQQFDPDADASVTAIAAQADGKLLLTGTFSSVGNTQRLNLARINADGSLDGAFVADRLCRSTIPTFSATASSKRDAAS